LLSYTGVRRTLNPPLNPIYLLVFSNMDGLSVKFTFFAGLNFVDFAKMGKIREILSL